MAGDDHDRHAPTRFRQRDLHIESVHSRHVEVEHETDRLVLHHEGEEILTGSEALHGQAAGLQQPRDRNPDGFLVIQNRD